MEEYFYQLCNEVCLLGTDGPYGVVIGKRIEGSHLFVTFKSKDLSEENREAKFEEHLGNIIEV